MKVVINGCYGGFGLSHEACILYAKKCGFELFGYVYDSVQADVIYHRINPQETGTITYVKADCGDTCTENGLQNAGYWCPDDIERDDTNLIEVVEELGVKASGTYAELKIVEIPDGIAYPIEEYDGNEHISETHHTWS